MPLKDTNANYGKFLKIWQKMRATVFGQEAVKGEVGTSKASDFLPVLDDPQSTNRNEKYIERALYANYTGWTHRGVLGSVFRKPPVIELPSTIEFATTNMEGSGIGLNEFSRSVVSENLELGRLGVLVDFPRVEGTQTQEQVDKGEFQAFCRIYKAENIYNWIAKIVNGTLILQQIRLIEKYIERDSEFEEEEKERFRILDLDAAGFYRQRLFDDEENQIGEDIYPTKNDGNKFTEIPFTFNGSEDNRPDIKKPPLLDIANVNLAHYRNSADLEENLFIYGQGTLFFTTSLSAAQWKTSNPNGIKVGSNMGHNLGKEGTAQLLQLESAGATQIAMDNKVVQIIAIGARYIQERSGTETVEATRAGASQRTSGLSNLVLNSQSAIVNCLGWMVDFHGGEKDQIVFTLNTDFYDKSLSPQYIMAQINLRDSKIVAKTDVREKLRESGDLAGDRTDKQIDSDIEKEGNESMI